MGELLLYRDLSVSLAIGLLIGIERGWRQRAQAAGTRVGGFRTFALLGGLGGVIGLLAKTIHPVIAAILLGGAVVVLATGYKRTMAGPDKFSATMPVASLLTLGLGMLATSGYPAIALSGAAVTTLLLSMRSQLHRFIRHLGEADIYALARFAIIAVAILPFLPNERFGPYDAWNPRQLWLVVVFVTGFSFAGYVANRVVGARYGTLATAVLGGMYSSTAVTVALSHRLRDGGEANGTLTAGIALASGVMFMRVLLLTAALASFSLVPLTRIIGPGVIVAVIIGLLLLAKSRTTTGEPEITSSNPIAIIPALGFLLIVAVMALAARWAEARFGGTGIVALLVISGSFDVDAAIVTLGGLRPGTLSADKAALVLAGPVIANTLFKAAIVALYAGWAQGKTAVLALLATAGVVVAVAGITLRI
jgi:uncharacterized membrane protein (DUF4010 family)